MDVYKDKLLKYPLTTSETTSIDYMWEFSQVFNFRSLYTSDYRTKVISDIQKAYTPERFFEYETILNKLFWNMRWLLFPLWIYPDMSKEEYNKFIKDNYGSYTEIPDALLLCQKVSYADNTELDKIINEELKK